MFKKIVSQLSFSPALVGQLGFYAKRLRKEEATRRLGLIFVALALVVQSLAVFQAPESANASSSSDMIIGGLGTSNGGGSMSKFLSAYDSNSRNLRDIMNYYGISRQQLVNTNRQLFTVGTKITHGYENRAGSTAIDIPDANWNIVNRIYERPMTAVGNKATWRLWGFVGYSERVGWFAIMQDCGNLILEKHPTLPQKPSPAKVVSSKSSVNVTQGSVNATTVKAKANDTIKYTVKASNTGGASTTITFSDDLKDVLNYASIVDKGGGTYSSTTKKLSWGKVTLAAGASVTKTYTVKMNSSLISDTTSCSMKNTFIDSSLTIKVNCTTPPAEIVSTKTAVNVTQGKVDATTTKAEANDQITYSVTASNTGGTSTTVDLVDNLNEITAYAKLIDDGGGTYDSDAETLSWGTVTVKPGAKVTKSYTVQMNSSLVSDTTTCSMKNTFLDSSITVNVNCTTSPAEIIVSKTAVNTTQGNVDATTVSAVADDRITFTLTAENTGGTAEEFTFEDTLSDAVEYAEIIDSGGGTYDESTKKLTWPTVKIEPEGKEIRTFTMKLLSEIPATPEGVSDRSSYDCQIENTFETASVIIPVTCPVQKVVEETVTELPHTGARENIIFAVILFAIALYFYLRSRQLGTEVRLIRRNLNGGTL